MKRTSYILLVVALCLSVPLCTQAQDSKEPKTGGKNDAALSPATKLIQRIVGSWKVQSQTDGNNDVTKNPTSGEWLEFRADGKYVNRAAEADSGSYRLNESQGILYLESQVAKIPEGKSVREYNIKMNNDNTMTLQKRATKGDKATKDKSGKAKADKTKFVYVRISQETSSIK